MRLLRMSFFASPISACTSAALHPRTLVKSMRLRASRPWVTFSCAQAPIFIYFLLLAW